ncbi:hypothetical protein CERSUDRAFT_121987 [Gelatoporia subvermispora B]|uniref:G-patch domain-containing protein n=1 Tax=Ceriporiopsis subvermispora (strain B) TaxID=914234 RepID=M2RMV8_CERS8|nr:hypothetical protein CERSUDRAFT_121987 [Gelatoporia subvermispora B]
MPIDGHAYLVSQGWEGKGSGLRQGAISRPITISQKKSLSGIGKDRDEAFPFWDHVFEAAAINIQVKLYDSDDSDDDSKEAVFLQRTKTGIISNRRPKTGTSALSGSATPTTADSSGMTPRYSVMAAAKQEAARRTLYSMFFRGPILGSDFDELPVAESSQGAREREAAQVAKVVETTAVRMERKKSKKRKDRDGEGGGEVAEDPEKRKRKAKKSEERDEEKREKKRRKREAAAADAEEVASRTQSELTGDTTPGSSSAEVASVDVEEHKRRKEEKRARKEDRRKRKAEKQNKEERKERKASREGKADKSSKSDKSERTKDS